MIDDRFGWALGVLIDFRLRIDGSGCTQICRRSTYRRFVGMNDRNLHGATMF